MYWNLSLRHKGVHAQFVYVVALKCLYNTKQLGQESHFIKVKQLHLNKLYVNNSNSNYNNNKSYFVGQKELQKHEP